MNLQTMRDILKDCLGGRASDLSNSTLDRELNFVWQYQMPNRIDGGFRQGTVEFDTVIDQDLYRYEDLDPLLRSLGPGMRRAEFLDPFDFYERETEFWDRYRFTPQGGATIPSGYLVRYSEVIIRPVPGVAEKVICPATFYPVPLTTDGLADEEEAHTLVYGAAVHLAHQNHWDGFIEKNNLFFTNGIRALQRKSRSRKRLRVKRPDY